ncbi:MAG TPA: hypothetical protein VMJ73_01585 [Rhizomicrobium sp.]|nr:hypothetical protein [Rhizomicrobium sp.]
MPRVSAAFFSTGIVCAVLAMLVGIRMEASHSFVLAPLQLQLNVVGWVSMVLYGTFYAMTRGTLSLGLAWTNYWVSLAGIVILVPALALYLSTNAGIWYRFVLAGDTITVGAMLVFAYSVFRELFRRRPPL